MVLVNEQGIPDLDSITFFDDNFGLHAAEIIGDQCELALGFQRACFQVCLALQVYVEAFA